MRRVIEVLAFMLIALCSGAFFDLIRDGGARDEGKENISAYSGPINALPSICLACVVFIVTILFISGKLRRIKFAWPWIALISFCFASILWSDIPRVSFRAALFIAVTYILINVQITLYGWEKTVRFLCLTFFIILICSFATILLFPSYGVAVGTHEGKWQGIFTHKNNLGNFAAISFVVFYWKYQQEKSKLSLMAAFFALFLVVGSQSGTAVFSVAAVIFICALLNFKFTGRIVHKLRYAIVIFLIILSFFAVFVAITFEQFSIFEKDSSFSNRNLIWVYIIAKITASPWIGYGLDQLGALTDKNSAEFFTNVGFIAGSAHNGFLETMFSLGLIGMVLMLWVFMSQLTKKNSGFGFYFLFSYLILYIVMNTFESRMIGFNVYFVVLMYVMAIAGAMASPNTIASNKKLARNTMH